jgi:hypothetical protein
MATALGTVSDFSGLTENEKRFSLTSLSLVTFLILYKIFDRIIMRKYDRHMHLVYFGGPFNRFDYDVNERENTRQENLFQFILFIIPIFWTTLGYIVF